MNRYFNHALAATLGLSFAAASAQAAVIVADDFETTDGTVGRTPEDINLPGNTYGLGGAAGTFTGSTRTTDPLNGSNSIASLDTAVRLFVDISSGGSYTKPTEIAISARLNLTADPDTGTTWVATSNDGQHGLGLGFDGALSGGGNAFDGFIGITFNEDGDLTLVNNGTVVESVSITGFDTSSPAGTTDTSDIDDWHTLTYTIDTATGDIVGDVVFDTFTHDFAATNIFTDAETNFAGAMVQADAAFRSGLVDDLLITDGVIPEPASFALLSLGGLLIMGRARKL